MKLRKVTINGKTYYEEVNEEVIEPEVIDPKEKEEKYDNEFKKNRNFFEKDSLKRDWSEFKKTMKGLGKSIKKNVDSANKWFVDSMNSNDTTNRLVKILPYMDEKDVHDIVKRILKGDKEFRDVDLAAIMPFISKDDCDSLFLKSIRDGNNINIKMVHYVSKDCLSYLVDSYTRGKYPDLDVDALYPFLDSEDVKKLFYYELKKNGNRR